MAASQCCESDILSSLSNHTCTQISSFPFYLLAADISKVMQSKRKRLECLTKNYMKGSQNKLEQLWNTYHGQRSGFLKRVT